MGVTTNQKAGKRAKGRVPESYPEKWRRWTRKLRGRGSASRVKALLVADKMLVVAFVALYLLIGLGCINLNPAVIIAYIGSTAVCYALLSLYRSMKDAPRPYEAYDIKPLVPEKCMTHGKSFPSRHAFCSFLIATMAAFILRPFGFVAYAMAAALGWMRVMEGVHFPRDVVAGALLGTVAGVFCTVSIVSALL